MLSNQTLKAQSNDARRLPMQEVFSTSVLATNFTAPHEIIYGPDDVLWLTERIGKDITRVDPETEEKLNSIPVPKCTCGSWPRWSHEFGI
ncbi:hypothetical protein [Candidatus Nitrosocosmicus arcticus]|uniref:Uncharacterized protein n=1 Tax=Candidatus Nitrosocosmicus arcticus TaxID=2035267 RepID=A0A557SWK3_9ARCH|nr:hypothetical protein [Candidatus Nitrosocosmicus arcticus]TVP40961.1 hypothetical protein NARC_50142 [Candidatus Nitrosocosmicus arcticus]